MGDKSLCINILVDTVFTVRYITHAVFGGNYCEI